jgi:hypothetical protein
MLNILANVRNRSTIMLNIQTYVKNRPTIMINILAFARNRQISFLKYSPPIIYLNILAYLQNTYIFWADCFANYSSIFAKYVIYLDDVLLNILVYMFTEHIYLFG